MKKLFIVFGFFLLRVFSFAQEEILVIKNVSVVDVKHNRLQTGSVVLIEGNKIIAIGKGISIPKAAFVLDAKGKYLIPGLWDMHVHSLRQERIPLYFPQFVANGITGIRDMSTPLEDFEVFKKSNAKTDTTIRPHFIKACGPALDGINNARPGLSIPIAKTFQAKETVDMLYSKGVDFIKVYSLLGRDAFFAVVEEAKKKGLPVVGHVPAYVSAIEASDAGMKSIEHSYGILEACSDKENDIRKEVEQAASNPNGPAAWAAVVRTTDKAYGEYAQDNFDKGKADTLFSHFVKNHTWQCPTLVVRQAFVMMNDSSFINDKRTQYISKADLDRWKPQSDLRHKDLTTEETKNRMVRLQEESKNVYRMKMAGVGILAGTDLGNPFIFPGFSLHDELALLVKAGLSPFEALQTATINPAVFFGMEDSLGTVEKGKIADLILLDANPLKNINNTKKIYAVIVNGKLLRRSDLDNLLSMASEQVKK